MQMKHYGWWIATVVVGCFGISMVTRAADPEPANPSAYRVTAPSLDESCFRTVDPEAVAANILEIRESLGGSPLDDSDIFSSLPAEHTVVVEDEAADADSSGVISALMKKMDAADRVAPACGGSQCGHTGQGTPPCCLNPIFATAIQAADAKCQAACCADAGQESQCSAKCRTECGKKCAIASGKKCAIAGNKKCAANCDKACPMACQAKCNQHAAARCGKPGEESTCAASCHAACRRKPASATGRCGNCPNAKCAAAKCAGCKCGQTYQILQPPAGPRVDMLVAGPPGFEADCPGAPVWTPMVPQGRGFGGIVASAPIATPNGHEVQVLREAAICLEQIAHELELLEKYVQADALRDQADALRADARANHRPPAPPQTAWQFPALPIPSLPVPFQDGGEIPATFNIAPGFSR